MGWPASLLAAWFQRKLWLFVIGSVSLLLFVLGCAAAGGPAAGLVSSLPPLFGRSCYGLPGFVVVGTTCTTYMLMQAKVTPIGNHCDRPVLWSGSVFHPSPISMHMPCCCHVAGCAQILFLSFQIPINRLFFLAGSVICPLHTIHSSQIPPPSSPDAHASSSSLLLAALGLAHPSVTTGVCLLA